MENKVGESRKSMLNEIEVYFPHDNTYIEANVQDWTRCWRFTCAWQHTRIRQDINIEDIPTDEATLKQMAIECYEQHKLRQSLRNMDPDMPKV